jgi:8-oxo-dGTP pyrophosphatase MutT (NUDIX family)
VSLQPWRYLEDEQLVDVRIFTLQRETAVSPRTGKARDFVHIASRNWVNVIPLTTSGEVVLVRQWRHGVKEFTLEIPGGLVDVGEAPGEAAAREAREETGYAGDLPVRLGVVEPNPAILNNVTYTYLIENCQLVGDQELDAGEDVEVVLASLADIPQLVGGGTIQHSLVICGFWWLAQRRPDLLRLA